MIPYLASTSTALAPPTLAERLIEIGFTGDVETDLSTRSVLSTDNSIYQVEPLAAVFPRHAQDLQIIARVLNEPTFAGIAVTPRGGGTGTNGQSLTNGIVVDCSRHMNRILEINPVARVARVQSGVVKDQLNRALKPYGLFFAPELSTSNRATIGGMVSTDACGQGSCLYGKTSDHVLGLRVVLTDGTDWWSRPLEESALQEVLTRKDRVGEIHRTISLIARDKGERIAEVFPKLNRYMTGYDLAHIRRRDGRFDLNAILCGSEGTLAMIAEVEVNLLPLPKHVALVNIRYDNFSSALEDARRLTVLSVASVETVDEKVLTLAKGDIVWSAIDRFFPEDPLVPSSGINIAEILADSPEELEEKLQSVTRSLDGDPLARRLGYTVAYGHVEAEAIWAMRKRAVGLLGNVEGPVRPVAFVEDTAVPPEHLAPFIREFRALLDDAGLSYGMFGHVDAGVLHVRPALDLSREDHVPLVRDISDAVVALTRKYGGVLWGEHGKGVRSEYVPEFFDDLYPCLQDIKRAFDPDNRLNPGKIATPDDTPLLKIDEVPFRGAVDRSLGKEIRAAFDNGTYCNGNGACFDFDETSPMCPSYKATGDRRYSPKGRATLMREWLKQLVAQNVHPVRQAEAIRKKNTLSAFPRRLLNSLNPANRTDFSHQVREAMDTCLACKACAGQCPVKVSVPSFRAKFLELYYSRYVRPLKDPLVAAIETTLPWMAKIRPIYNFVATTSVGQRLMRLMGLTALPALPTVSLAKITSNRNVAIADAGLLATMSKEDRHRCVIFAPDAFTAYFDPQVVEAALILAEKLGLIALLAPTFTNGKALHVHGYLGKFASEARRTAKKLNELGDFGIPIVGLDPSMTLAFRSEYKSSPEIALSASILLPQEWLMDCLRGERSRDADRRKFKLMTHCTERSNVASSATQWQAVFAALGIDLTVENVGCCGMAGTFGHEVRNRKISEKLYDMSWRPVLARAGGTDVLMATGYSCRSQVKLMERKRVPHPLEIVAELVETSDAGAYTAIKS
ncbi:FAD-binding and (Fe-S)-binding domain-containing protein [Rhizobium sp. NPDC090275]|uniref:D-2-hydroxyglutarate dehydrogenase YdiJ n=1 Tax=Rhizobium sp. NPDC090275 TaxID=3364498 RepID=UPI00383AE197